MQAEEAVHSYEFYQCLSPNNDTALLQQKYQSKRYWYSGSVLHE